MTSIESIKYIVYGTYNDCDLSDTDINDLYNKMGYNEVIRYLALAKKTQLSSMPTSVNDGANSFSFNDRLKALDDIISLAEKYSFRDPEATEQTGTCFSADLKPDRHKDYWGV